MRGYAFPGTAIAVTSDLEPMALWLDEFLTPAFDRCTAEGADFVVAIRTDRAAYDALAATRPPGAPEAPCFALDQEVVHHPAWTTPGGTVLADAKYGALYVLTGARAELVAHPDAALFRVSAMRVVREIATSRALADPCRLQLHAAALEVDGRAVALAGAKGAGKTTFLAYLAAATRARILTNDRALVSLAAHGFEIRGVPTIVSIRPETLELLPGLFRGIPAVERPAHLTLAEAEAAFAARGGIDGAARLMLSPPQLARALGVSLCASAGLAAIAFPEPDPDPESLAIERLSATAAERRLDEARFGRRSGTAAPTVFERFTGTRRPAGADQVLLARIAARVPCFSVRIGAARYRTPEAATAIVSTVLERG